MRQSPFKPYVTLEQVRKFIPGREETYTPSPLVNAVLTAMLKERMTRQIDVAYYLNIETTRLGGCIVVATGHSFNEVRDAFLRATVERLKAENPKWSLGRIAKELGYSSTASIWRVYHREFDKKTNAIRRSR